MKYTLEHCKNTLLEFIEVFITDFVYYLYGSCEFYDMHKELVPYAEAWSWQKDLVKKRKELTEEEDCSDTLIILQHHPVYTLGTYSSEAYLNFSMENPPFNVYRTERGGEVTYHGPGQVYSAFQLNFVPNVLEYCVYA